MHRVHFRNLLQCFNIKSLDKMRFFLLFFTAVSVASSASVSVSLGKHVKTTVYSGNSAEMERLVEVPEVLAPGEYHTIAVDGLCDNIQESSIRVKASADNIEILDMKVNTFSTPRRELKEYTDLLRRLENLRNEYYENMQKSQLESNLKESYNHGMNEYVHHLIKNPNGTISREELIDLLEFRKNETMKRYEDKSFASIYSQTMHNRYHELENKLNHLRNQEYGTYDFEYEGIFLPAVKTRKVLSFRVLLHESRPFEVVVSYIASPASWSPEYDIEIAPAATAGRSTADQHPRNRQYTLSIDYYANVVQSTGESWLDTPLVLSSANPAGLFYKHPEAPVSQGIQLSPGGLHMFSDQPTCQPTSAPSMQPSSRPSMQPSGQPSVQSSISPTAYTSTMSNVMMQAEGSTSGDIYKFLIPYPVSVDNSKNKTFFTSPGTLGQRHLILVDRIKVLGHMFTFAVPSIDEKGQLLGWGRYNSTAAAAASCVNDEDGACVASTASSATTIVHSSSPLLASSLARVSLQGDNLGTISVDRVQPGGMIQLNLGVDQQIHIASQKVMPEFKGEEEDKSTWFTKDKKQWRVKTEERSTTIRSSYGSTSTSTAASSAGSNLVIISENLPKSLEMKEVLVELLSSTLKDALTLEGGKKAAVAEGEVVAENFSNEGFLEAILKRETTAATSAGSASATTITVYYNTKLGHLYWAVWLKPGESVTIPFKYKISWPAELRSQL